MKFRFTPKLRRARPGSEERTFTIHRLWKDEAERATEITHLFDRTYRLPFAARTGLAPRRPLRAAAARRRTGAEVSAALGRLAISRVSTHIAPSRNNRKEVIQCLIVILTRSPDSQTWMLASDEVRAA